MGRAPLLFTAIRRPQARRIEGWNLVESPTQRRLPARIDVEQIKMGTQDASPALASSVSQAGLRSRVVKAPER